MLQCALSLFFCLWLPASLKTPECNQIRFNFYTLQRPQLTKRNSIHTAPCKTENHPDTPLAPFGLFFHIPERRRGPCRWLIATWEIWSWASSRNASRRWISWLCGSFLSTARRRRLWNRSRLRIWKQNELWRELCWWLPGKTIELRPWKLALSEVSRWEPKRTVTTVAFLKFAKQAAESGPSWVNLV